METKTKMLAVVKSSTHKTLLFICVKDNTTLGELIDKLVEDHLLNEYPDIKSWLEKR